ncbi:MAG: hypothetical protein ACR2I5_12630 [Candidatus Limnocylindria bacterium]
MRLLPLIILAAVVGAFFVILTVARGPIDADYWWHLTTGDLIVNGGSSFGVDPYSFAYDGPWVMHEWLGEVVIYVLVSRIGYPITAALFGLAAAGSLIVPAYVLFRRGIPVRALLPFVAIGAYTLASFTTVRPQVLSWLLLAVVIVLLMQLHPQQRLRPWLLPPLFVLWANVHGLWVIGLAILAVYSAFTLFGRTPMAARRGSWLAVTMASVAGSALTPAGVEGFLYPLRYLSRDDWGTSFIAEWQPADVSDPRQWGLILLAVAAVLLVRRGSTGWLAAVAALGLVAGFVAVRNQPLTAIMTMPTLALALASRFRIGSHGALPTADLRRAVLEVGLAVIVVAAFLVVLPRAVEGSEASAYPVVAFDELVKIDPDARLFVDYDWGGYAIHRMHPTDGLVFIDGRSDMYPRRVFEDYLAIRSASDVWQALVAEYRIGAMLLPPTAPIVAAALESGWCAAHADERAVVLLPCSKVSWAAHHSWSAPIRIQTEASGSL